MSNALSRRDFLTMAAASVASPLAGRLPSPARAAGPQKKRPNILFLFADDQAFSTVGALNNADIRTPTIDKLVRDGTAFTHAFIMGSMSGAVCFPSRAMLLSGRGLFRAPLRPGTSGGPALWPETFRNAGYATFGTGKWHNGPAAYARCFTHGGNIFFGGMSNHLKVPVHDFDPQGKYPRSGMHAGKGFSSNLFSDAAIGFLKRRQADKELRTRPFFGYVSYTAPHDPRMAPKEYAAMYPPEKIPLPKNFMPEHPFDNGEMRIRDERLAPWPRTKPIVRQHIAAYYAMITHLDAQMGRVLQALQEAGEADNTLIIFSGDNGLAVGQHGLMGKQNLYEHSVRVPLIFCGPGIEKGKRIDALCYIHDLFPTTCELAGLRIPTSVESLSLAPLLTGRKAKLRDSVYAAYRNVQRMVRTERWKLIRYPHARKTQLFDIQADPWEISNLADDPKHADRLKQLNAELKKWQKEVGDTLDVDNPPARRPARGQRKRPAK